MKKKAVHREMSIGYRVTRALLCHEKAPFRGKLTHNKTHLHHQAPLTLSLSNLSFSTYDEISNNKSNYTNLIFEKYTTYQFPYSLYSLILENHEKCYILVFVFFIS